MSTVLNFVGLHLITQVLLLIVFLKARHLFSAIHELYSYSPKLFYFYGVGIAAQGWLIWTVVRRYLLLASVGRKASRAAQTRGFE